uniref:Transposase n=1 Tax=Ditylenchus dipsaci TaxID=166011 RepID=A0A915DCQ9_9BILA
MPRSTVKNIVGNKDSILYAIDVVCSAKRAHLKADKHADLEKSVLRWFKAARNESSLMSVPLLAPKTLVNCFQKAGYIKNVEPAEPEKPPEDDDELNTLWAVLHALNLVSNTWLETLTLAEIAADVSTANVEELNVDSDGDLMEVKKELKLQVTNREVTAGFKVFQRYMEENFKDPALLQMCDKFDNLLAKERSRKINKKTSLIILKAQSQALMKLLQLPFSLISFFLLLCIEPGELFSSSSSDTISSLTAYANPNRPMKSWEYNPREWVTQYRCFKERAAWRFYLVPHVGVLVLTNLHNHYILEKNDETGIQVSPYREGLEYHSWFATWDWQYATSKNTLLNLRRYSRGYDVVHDNCYRALSKILGMLRPELDCNAWRCEACGWSF